MRIYKNKDITTNIDTEKMSINNSDTYLSDGLHPNTFGYTYLAEQFSKKLPYKL